MAQQNRKHPYHLTDDGRVHDNEEDRYISPHEIVARMNNMVRRLGECHAAAGTTHTQLDDLCRQLDVLRGQLEKYEPAMALIPELISYLDMEATPIELLEKFVAAVEGN